jgi:hypothetical protein
MKQQDLTLFFAMGGLGSLTLLSALLASPSAEQHNVFAGLSGPRLTIAALILVAVVVFVGLWLFSAIKSSWALHLGQLLDGWLRSPENLLVASFFSLLVVITIPVAVFTGALLQYGQVIRRTVELIILFEYLSVLLLGLLLTRYHTVY